MNDQPEHSKSQKAKLLQAFQQGFALTGLDALKLCGTLCFPRRCKDLVSDGYDLQSNWVTVNGKRVKQWHLPNSTPTQQRMQGI